LSRAATTTALHTCTTKTRLDLATEFQDAAASIQVVSILKLVNPYSDTLLVQTTICADQYEAAVDLVRLCEDKSSVRRPNYFSQCENCETRIR